MRRLVQKKPPDKLFDSFYDKVSDIVDPHLPIRQLSNKEVNKI